MQAPLVPAEQKSAVRRWLTIALLVIFICCYTQVCPAQTLSIQENQSLQFGVLQRPAGAPETFTVDPAGATSGTGTLLYGSTSRGMYTIRCTASCAGSWTLTIDIQNVNSGNANLTLGNFQGTYQTFSISSFPQSGLPRPLGAGSSLRIGATATYTSSISAGPVVPTFDLVVTTP